MPTTKQKPFKSRLKQNLMFSFYTDISNKETFDNAKQSALKAGYSESQADNITAENWFRERLENFENIEGLAESIVKKNLERSDTNTMVVKDNIGTHLFARFPVLAPVTLALFGGYQAAPESCQQALSHIDTKTNYTQACLVGKVEAVKMMEVKESVLDKVFIVSKSDVDTSSYGDF